MNNTVLPGLADLLPVVHVDATIIRHVRTLFYSSTRDHEHLANLSITLSDDSLKITVIALLPTVPLASSNIHSSSLPSSSTASPSSFTVPLLSNLTDKPLQARRPSHVVSSLLSLFPPSATCQASPSLKVHVTLPHVRYSLSDQSDLLSSVIKLAQNSMTILLTTGQCNESAGLLLSPRKGRATKLSGARKVETLTPVSFSAAGNTAGVWVRGDDTKTATLALHALAAAWWTRRNYRLTLVPTKTQISGEWYERRVWLLRFLDGGRVTVQNGTISVCDDPGSSYVASFSDSTTVAHFQIDKNRQAPSQPSSLGEGWHDGWVAASTNQEIQEAQKRRRKPPEVLLRSNGGRSRSVEADIAKSSSRLSKMNHSLPSDHEGSFSDQIRDSERQSTTVDDGLLTARMQELTFRRHDDNIRSPTTTATSGDRTRDVSSDKNPENTPRDTPEKRTPHIIDAQVLSESEDSNCDLSSPEGLNMEALCRKYLECSYGDQINRQYRKEHETSGPGPSNR